MDEIHDIIIDIAIYTLKLLEFVGIQQLLS